MANISSNPSPIQPIQPIKPSTDDTSKTTTPQKTTTTAALTDTTSKTTTPQKTTTTAPLTDTTINLTETDKTELKTILSDLKEGIQKLADSYTKIMASCKHTPIRMRSILSSGKISSTLELSQAIKQVAGNSSSDSKVTDKLQTLSTNKTVTTKAIIPILAKIDTDMETLNKKINTLETKLGKVDKENTDSSDAINAQNGTCPPSQAPSQTSRDKSSKNFSDAEVQGKEATQIGSESKSLTKDIKSMKTELDALQNTSNELVKALVGISTGVDSKGQDKGRTGPSHTSLHQNVSTLVNNAKNLMNRAGSEQIKVLGNSLSAAVYDYTHNMSTLTSKSNDIAADAWFKLVEELTKNSPETPSTSTETPSSETPSSETSATSPETPSPETPSSETSATSPETPSSKTSANDSSDRLNTEILNTEILNDILTSLILESDQNTGNKSENKLSDSAINNLVATLTEKYSSLVSEFADTTDTASKTLGFNFNAQKLNDIQSIIDPTAEEALRASSDDDSDEDE